MAHGFSKNWEIYNFDAFAKYHHEVTYYWLHYNVDIKAYVEERNILLIKTKSNCFVLIN